MPEETEALKKAARKEINRIYSKMGISKKNLKKLIVLERFLDENQSSRRKLKEIAMWKVSYKYINPSGAGPFKGKMVLQRDNPKRGEEIYGPFGIAKITNVKEVKESEPKTS